MAQMKEQNKTPEKELNEMGIANPSDAEFKTLVISMVKELIEWRKRNKGRKKNPQGTNSGENEAKNQINNLEHKDGKSIESEQQKEKKN